MNLFFVFILFGKNLADEMAAVTYTEIILQIIYPVVLQVELYDKLLYS